MQNKLFSLVAIVAIVVSCNVNYAQETVPVISDAQHAENQKKYRDLAEEINALEGKASEKKAEKDAIESNLHSYEQRVNFRNQLIKELAGEKDAIQNYKSSSDKKADERELRMKKNDNGITTTWFGYLNEPISDSRSGKEYARIAARIADQKDSNNKMSHEHAGYMRMVEADILPELHDILSRKIGTMNDHLAAFAECGCYTGTDYDKCLDDQGLTMRQRSAEFPSAFVARAYQAAYENAKKNNIPVTQEEIIAIALANKITKEKAAQAELKKEVLKRSIERELVVEEKAAELVENK